MTTTKPPKSVLGPKAQKRATGKHPGLGAPYGGITPIAMLMEQNERLIKLLYATLNTLDRCPQHESGIGGMTIEAQIGRTKINQVPAALAEDIRAVLMEVDFDGKYQPTS